MPGPRNNGKPPVASVLLRKRGALRGIRMISTSSLLEFINAQKEGGNNNEG